ncbi:GAF domain-containing protein [Actinomadura opuntiae]|uniref:GAF domain-containing protein n=1 Tax=Actinomadura sp. OS1-43 TaxID=604315 RepID=UPI00255B0473|nr:GAF domain-containing protein [Actinomadura sp. OS1-43]MDL4815278.1 GAF domain-containing protein [Actinomadura sp. OS1-43]
MSEDLATSTWGPPRMPRDAADGQRFAASFDLMAAVLDGTPLPDLLDLVAAQAKALAHVPLAFIALPVDDGHMLRIEVADGVGGDRIRGLTVRRGRSMLGRAFASRRALSARIVADQTLSRLPAGPILILPLETGETTRGVLAVLGHPGAQPFGPGTARQLLLFADMAARLVELAEERPASRGGATADGAHVVDGLRPPRPRGT